MFDVSDSDSYKKGGDYEKFAGRDITMASAHYSTEEKYLDMVWNSELRLNVQQEQNIQSFFIMLCQKYKIVGSFKSDDRKDQ